MDKLFYRDFENQFRGSREAIRLRLSAYDFLVSALKQKSPTKKIIDIGCGRGEWLEYLKQNGIQAQGIDLDPAFIEICQQSGLNVIQSDALTYIKSLPDDSVSMISSFHMIEHLKFSDLEILFAEIHRVLEPGGIVLLETPNPQNLYVSSCTFHYDPTHLKPIPEPLLKFMLSHTGFKSVFTKFVNHNESLSNKEHVELYDVLTGVSPDYSVIAVKGNKAKSLLSEIDSSAFPTQTGLHDLSQRYQDYNDTKIQSLNLRIVQLEKHIIRLQELDMQVQHLQSIVTRFKDNWLVNSLYRLMKKVF